MPAEPDASLPATLTVEDSDDVIDNEHGKGPQPNVDKPDINEDLVKITTEDGPSGDVEIASHKLEVPDSEAEDEDVEKDLDDSK